MLFSRSFIVQRLTDESSIDNYFVITDTRNDRTLTFRCLYFILKSLK
ncbi:unnamed protein product [Brugia timori]|uniref:Bm1651 n=2 Tax=Brugia TaxID=6278 RepID=A0A1I9G6A5_BRUMA|nr:Bm1651 [Brugia malayi]VDO24206.1 unnamed protein product [Brugia timori]